MLTPAFNVPPCFEPPPVLTKTFPPRSPTNTSSPATIDTSPRLDPMMPELDTCRPTKLTSPVARITPALCTSPVSSVNRFRPATKSSSLIFPAAAIIPPTLSNAPLWKNTPDGFTNTTCPFALSCPKIRVGLPSVTRLSTRDFAPGCTNVTASLRSMLNPRKLITARSDARICIRPPSRLKSAFPRATASPVGNATAREPPSVKMRVAIEVARYGLAFIRMFSGLDSAVFRAPLPSPFFGRKLPARSVKKNARDTGRVPLPEANPADTGAHSPGLQSTASNAAFVLSTSASPVEKARHALASAALAAEASRNTFRRDSPKDA